MAIEPLDKTLEPPDPQGAMRYVQFDAIRMVVDKNLFDNTLVRLVGEGKHPGARVPRSEIEAVLRGAVGAEGLRYDVVITNAQYETLLAYLEKGSYFYLNQGDPKDAKFVLAFSYGERGTVNSKIRYEIETRFGRKRKPPSVYAQWEIADMPPFDPDAGLRFNRIGIDPGEDYITTRRVVEKFKQALGQHTRVPSVYLACQAWHGPRCWRTCADLGVQVVGRLFVDLFSLHDPQPWVRDPMSWVIKEAQR